MSFAARVAFAALLFCSLASAKVIYYVGTFNPFHQSHLEELQAAMRAHPDAKIVILPVESGYYNRLGNFERPSFFSYEDNLTLIRAAVGGNARITVSDSLRRIDRDVLSEVQRAVTADPDPDRTFLCGTDVLRNWKDLAGFPDFIREVSLLVGGDARTAEADRELRKKLEGPRIQFLNDRITPLRGTDVTRAFFRDPKSAIAYFPKDVQKLLHDRPDILQRLHHQAIDRLRAANREMAKGGILPKLKQAGLDADLLAAIEANPLLQDALMLTDFKQPAEITRFVARVDAVIGKRSFNRTAEFYAATAAVFAKADLATYQDRLDFTRHCGISEQNYLFGPAPGALPSAFSTRAAPGVLYHWTSPTKLNQMAQTPALGETAPPFLFIGRHQGISKEHPQLPGRNALFTWHEPVSGMMSEGTVAYARREGDQPARLLALKIKPGARVVDVRSRAPVNGVAGGGFTYDQKSIPGLDQADLIYHEAYDANGTHLWSEWVVLNPNIVESYSADPRELAPLVRDALAKLKDPHSVYAPADLFIPSRPLRREPRIEILEDYLGKGPEGIPAVFLAKPAGIRSCAWPELGKPI